MKIRLISMLLLTVLLLSACATSSNTIVPTQSQSTTEAGDVTETGISPTITPEAPITDFGSLMMFYNINDPFYNSYWKGDEDLLTESELYDQATHIFTAEVVNTSFVVKENTNFLDMTTFDPNECNIIDGLQIHTVYELKPLEIYKGEPAETYYLEMLGGLYVDDYLNEQYELIKKHGLYPRDEGRVWLPITELECCYPWWCHLFVLTENDDGTLRFINTFQGITYGKKDSKLIEYIKNIKGQE